MGDYQTIENLEKIDLLLKKTISEVNRIKYLVQSKNKFTITTIENNEMRFINWTVNYYQGNITKAAKSLNIARSTLYRKLDKLIGREENEKNAN